MKTALYFSVPLLLGIAACTRTENTVQLNKYPLTVGNMWVYSTGDTIRAVSDTVINGITATKLTKTNARYSQAIYCANLPDGLHLLASNGPNYTFQSMVIPVIEESSSLNVPATSVQLTLLPVVINSSWEGHVPSYKYSPRTWTQFVNIITPAGAFNCIKLTGAYFDEYYSNKGLVKHVDHPNCLVSPCPDVEIKLVYVNF